MMKLKLMPVLAGVIALTVTAAPLAVKAEPNQLNQPLPKQAQNRRGAEVELTQQQKDKLVQIRSDTRAQIEKILTPQQREQFKAAMQSPQGRQAAFAAMNLSPKQQTELREVMQSAQTRVEAILTPEQRQQIQQSIQERRQRKE
jgi:Spy/CpxP family protein refolding chaperone